MNNTKIRYFKFTNVFIATNVFRFNNCFNFKSINSLNIMINIEDLKSVKPYVFFKSMALLESLTCQKSFLKNYSKLKKKKSFLNKIFTCKTTLRKVHLFNFLYLFIFFSTINFSLKFIKISKILNYNNNYSFTLKNITVFPGVLENFYKWSQKLSFYLIFNSSKINDQTQSLFLLRNYGFLI